MDRHLLCYKNEKVKGRGAYIYVYMQLNAYMQLH